MGRKRYESTQSAREDEPTSVGVVEAASSSLVTQTKIEKSELILIGDGFGFFVFFDSTERYVRNKRGKSADEHSDKEYTEPMSGESMLPDDIKTGGDEV